MSNRPERDPDDWRDQMRERHIMEAEAEEAEWLRTKRLKARVAELEKALRDLLEGMGVVMDDPRLSYVEVQLDRVDIRDARAALPTEGGE